MCFNRRYFPALSRVVDTSLPQSAEMIAQEKVTKSSMQNVIKHWKNRWEQKFVKQSLRETQ